MHGVLYFVEHQFGSVVCFAFFGFHDSIPLKELHWVLLLYATMITGVVVETFPFLWTLPVSSRCHFAFHPHPLVRISATLLWVSVGEYRSLWVMVCFVISACNNTYAHWVVLSSPLFFFFFFSRLWRVQEFQIVCVSFRWAGTFS